MEELSLISSLLLFLKLSVLQVDVSCCKVKRLGCIICYDRLKFKMCAFWKLIMVVAIMVM
jgi:hypothetical protein